MIKKDAHSCVLGDYREYHEGNQEGHQVTFNSKSKLAIREKSMNVLTPEAVFDGVSSFSLHRVIESSLVVVLSAQSALAHEAWLMNYSLWKNHHF